MRLPALLALALPAAALAQAMPGMDHDMPGMSHGDMAGMDVSGHAMLGAYGPYSMSREASGTAWQPDASTHGGPHFSLGGWSLMVHGRLNLVYTEQSGPRGDDKTFVAGHLMAMASRDLSDRDHIQFRLAVSPDPFMGPRGYPLLLATGETADGTTNLVDRQHPHDLFSELSVSVSHRLSDTASLFAYAGLPGEPAFGPPAYVHRQSIQDNPEAPISHHWLDSTHISEGVVTLGAVAGDWKLEASRFRGREPDQHRYDIETPKLDSTAVRLAWNPLRELSLQVSWAHQKSPEQLVPDENVERWSASAIYTRTVGRAGIWATTAAWGRRTAIEGGHRDKPLDAFLLETAVQPDPRWTLFARAERGRNDELVGAAGGGHGAAYTVARVSGGVIRDFAVARNLALGIGGLVSQSIVPGPLDPVYGGDRTGATGFLRLKLT